MELKEQIRLTNITNIWGCQLNTSWALYTCVSSVQSSRYKYRKQTMSTKQGIHRWSMMIKNKYGC